MKGAALKELGYFRNQIIVVTAAACFMAFFMEFKLSAFYMVMNFISGLCIASVFFANTDHLQFYSSVGITKKQIVTFRIVSILIFEMFCSVMPFFARLAFGRLRYLVRLELFGDIYLLKDTSFVDFIDEASASLGFFAWFNLIFYSMIYRKNHNKGILEYFLGAFGPAMVLFVIIITYTFAVCIYSGMHSEIEEESIKLFFDTDEANRVYAFGKDITDDLYLFKDFFERISVRILLYFKSFLVWLLFSFASYSAAKKKIERITV